MRVGSERQRSAVRSRKSLEQPGQVCPGALGCSDKSLHIPRISVELHWFCARDCLISPVRNASN